MEASIKKSGRRVLEGLVVSSKMEKSITVKVTRTVRHPRYNKFVKKHAKYHAHDENSACKLGDVVSIVEARPTSKTKKWRIKEVLTKVIE
ncbi:MAG: 30S ribosomal protein S17 [bacterium]|nr:30S ribosomal protein S17 [bacterium]